MYLLQTPSLQPQQDPIYAKGVKPIIALDDHCNVTTPFVIGVSCKTVKIIR